MVLWGAMCGGVLGLLWRGHDWEFHLLVGIVLGALAGLGLRRAIRAEIKAALAAKPAAAPVAAAPRVDAPADEDFQATLPQPLPVPTASAAAAPATEPPRQAPARPPKPWKPDLVTVAFGRTRAWLFGGNTVVRMGVLVLFVGLAFLAKFAIDNALLPPELRLAAIGAAGIALFAGGFRLRGKAPDKLAYALTLQGAGIAVLYLTVFAAFRLYQFLPAGAAFAALGLVCAFAAVIAVAQNAMPMAFIGFAGGFAAPILVSTGQGNHVGLFSYYLLLGVAIAGLAWAKAWRPLNLLGFFATFGVATLWGVLKYRPEHFDTTEPFLIAFFLVYLVASLLYALRHSQDPKKAVDATLIFGTPIVAFSLQAALVRPYEYATAFSSLAMGALYLGLGWWMARRTSGRGEVHRWLAECFAALGLGFVTLAVPLALDARWTSAVWAIEGAAVFWMGRRQGRWLARTAGLALQGLAAVAFLESHASSLAAQWPFAHPAFIGGLMLALAAFGIAHWSRDPAADAREGMAGAFARLEHGLSPFLFWLGFLWLQYALNSEIERMPLDAQGIAVPVFDAAARLHLHLLAWVGSAFALHHLALPARQRPWPIAATPAYTVLPVMVITALFGVLTLDHVFKSGGWISWPLVLLMHLVMLRRLDAGPPQRWWPWVHAGGVWLLVLLVGNLLVFAVGQAKLWQTAWATVILLVSAIVVLLLLSRRAWFAAAREGGPWPLNRYGRAYLWLAAAPLVFAVALACLLVAVHSDGNAKPLPYVPLLNPTDLAIALGLGACAAWLTRLRQSELGVPAMARDTRWLLALAAIGFIAINTVWLRVAHHYAGIPWDGSRLFDSFLVQAGYSILWTLMALGLMVGSHRRGLRAAWMLGAGLLGLTVLKLFVIDLSNRGGSERIFVFIAVGILMLVVGYFAPLPPVARRSDETLQGARP
ncbi:DUF2339 domain-containing protein [Caenimonas soli]|uniref:DUF2339 domain-containing protein n=1 Tax=Caenimonas soli TaxID=2735555 RepID=UPI00155831F1|nr:DUF2339 domain-containing protein [Caenimonas soli]NPC54746.1 DUF2339 domain-containing protein [Caenimonas soli]